MKKQREILNFTYRRSKNMKNTSYNRLLSPVIKKIIIQIYFSDATFYIL